MAEPTEQITYDPDVTYDPDENIGKPDEWAKMEEFYDKLPPGMSSIPLLIPFIAYVLITNLVIMYGPIPRNRWWTIMLSVNTISLIALYHRVHLGAIEYSQDTTFGSLVWTGGSFLLQAIWFTVWYGPGLLILLFIMIFIFNVLYTITLFAASGIAIVNTIITMPWWVLQFEVWRAHVMYRLADSWVEPVGFAAWFLGETVTAYVINYYIKLPSWGLRSWSEIEIWLNSKVFPDKVPLQDHVFWARLAGWWPKRVVWAAIGINFYYMVASDHASEMAIRGLLGIRPAFRKAYIGRAWYVLAAEFLARPVYSIHVGGSHRGFANAFMGTLLAAWTMPNDILAWQSTVMALVYQIGLIYVRESSQLASYYYAKHLRYGQSEGENPWDINVSLWMIPLERISVEAEEEEFEDWVEANNKWPPEWHQWLYGDRRQRMMRKVREVSDLVNSYLPSWLPV